MAIAHSGISVLRRIVLRKCGKEGTVVKEWVKEAYHSGQRAYMRDGYNVIGTTVLGKMVTYQEVLISDMDIWHALRAYQDAERKKGVPIRFDAPLGDTYLPWNRRTYGDFWFGSKSNGPGQKRQPIIEIFSFGQPHIDRCHVGRFTNFRWRAGYQKGGEHAA